MIKMLSENIKIYIFQVSAVRMGVYAYMDATLLLVNRVLSSDWTGMLF